MLRYFPNAEARSEVNGEFARFSHVMGEFAYGGSLREREVADPEIW